MKKLALVVTSLLMAGASHAALPSALGAAIDSVASTMLSLFGALTAAGVVLWGAKLILESLLGRTFHIRRGVKLKGRSRNGEKGEPDWVIYSERTPTAAEVQSHAFRVRRIEGAVHEFTHGRSRDDEWADLKRESQGGLL